MCMKESNDRKVCHGVSSGEPHTVHNRKSGVQREEWWANAKREKRKEETPKREPSLAERSRSLLRVKKANRHSIAFHLICHM